MVSSRLGVSAAAVDVGPKLDLFELASQYAEANGGLEYLVCDEAQFYTPAQVEQLGRVVDELNADVHAFGLLTDFRGKLFEGSARFLELADERQELQVEAALLVRRPRHPERPRRERQAGLRRRGRRGRRHRRRRRGHLRAPLPPPPG